jgi:hypothetical protein
LFCDDVEARLRSVRRERALRLATAPRETLIESRARTGKDTYAFAMTESERRGEALQALATRLAVTVQCAVLRAADGGRRWQVGVGSQVGGSGRW